MIDGRCPCCKNDGELMLSIPNLDNGTDEVWFYCEYCDVEWSEVDEMIRMDIDNAN